MKGPYILHQSYTVGREDLARILLRMCLRDARECRRNSRADNDGLSKEWRRLSREAMLDARYWYNIVKGG